MMAALALLIVGGTVAARGDEGMWLFNQPPKKILREKYGFQPTAPWLANLQQASVRFNSGGSGSFVSSDGLVMTNHHVGADALQKLSSRDRDYIATGFHARSQAEEIKCVDLELNVLASIEDVTARINAAVKPGATPAEAQNARRAAMNNLEKESADKTGLRCDVVTLYRGGLYHLYSYKRYTDVRLVFAPEMAIAFFGGDPDNFEYPRYDLDICFFRIYENDCPLKVEHYLKWSAEGAGDGELVFVSGHPGHTNRLDTVANLQFLRDRLYPYTLNLIRRREVLLSTFSERGLENARRAKEDLFAMQNARKARAGGLAGLQDPTVMDGKRRDEKQLRDAVQADPRLKQSAGEAWGQVASAVNAWNEIFYRHQMLEAGHAFLCKKFEIARFLVRLAEESAKPNADRLREYRESNLQSVRLMLFSGAPIYDDLDTVKLADALGMYMELAGADNELVEKVLAGKSPRARAAELVRGSRLADVAVRKQLADGGLKAIQSSDDPMIRLARLVDGPARRVRKSYEDKVDEPLRQAYAKIADARFALKGTEVYPDATFTLRLSFGEVKGYTDLGVQLPPWTTLGGAYRHAEEHGSHWPFTLPQSWLDRKPQFNLDTPFNFVLTADIIGGNSGSPVVNRRGELVGIIFDGNLESLVWDFVYTEETGRAIAVHSSAIREALRKVYDDQKLADELGR
jgi:hypothetical protein